MAGDSLTWLEQHAAEFNIDLTEFWAGAQVVAECGVIDPTPELAKRIKSRLETGEQYETAMRQSIDEVLVEGRRNSA